MTATATFPERFVDVKSTFVRPQLPEKYLRRPFALPPQDKLSPELIAAIDAAGGRDECDRRVQAFSKHREEYLIAMLDEPVGSPFRTVHGAEVLTSSAEPILLVHCHISQLRIFRRTVRDIIGEQRPWVAFMKTWPQAVPMPQGLGMVKLSPGDYFIDPADPLAAVRGLAALRPRGATGALLSYSPDGHPAGPAERGRLDTTFLGLRRPMSSFLPWAVRATPCRIVFGVGELRWPIEDGMDFRFFETVTRDELLGLDDERLLRRVLGECEKMIYANIWSWTLWEFFGPET